MKYGVQYYPEHWPEERWTIDAAMMQRAGVNVVRMGEFAWGAYEPQQGQLDFSWMERAINLLGNHGVRTILCTCARTPPPWMYRAYPGICSIRQDGRSVPTDGRYAVGLCHAEFIEQGQRIDEAVIRRFAGNHNVVAWQVDNEVGGGNDCYCERCLSAFRAYLKDKYGTPQALNDAWGADFWSFHFTHFDEVPVPDRQPQLTVEYRRFMSKLNVDFTSWRTERIHALDPGKPVTTNCQNINAAHTDCYQLMQAVDVSGMNHYPSRTPELAIDVYRGARHEIWALEQHTRLQPVDTPAGRMRLWAWMTVAHGATAIVFFRWRQCRWGQEQFADGLLPHSGRENRFYAELAQMGSELQKLGDRLDATRPQSRAAVVYSYESRWAVPAGKFGRELAPVPEAMAYHRALARRLTSIDGLDPRQDLSGYALVIAPRLWIVDEAIAANMHRYVEGGGTLCLTVGSGVADAFAKSFDIPRPGPLQPLAGITVSDLACDPDMRLPVESDTIPGLSGSCGRHAADEIHAGTAQVVATYARGWRKGLPAVTINTIGAGRVIYVGTLLDDAGVAAVTDWLCARAGIGSALELPEGVSAYERVAENYRLLFLVNWNEAPETVVVGDGWMDAFSRETVADAQIDAGDLRILQSL